MMDAGQKTPGVPDAPSPRAILTTCIICRDSEATIGNCIDSLVAAGVDCINITDTGSKDKTVRIIKKKAERLKKRVGIILTHFKWIDDFSAARNFNFDQAPPQTSWYLWVDSDDTIEEAKPGDLRRLVDGCAPEIGCFWLPYNYARDEFGNCITMFIRERILRADIGWHWNSLVHETVAPDGECVMVKDVSVMVVHNIDHSSRSDRNFGLLKRMMEEDPANIRSMLYMGHQHFAEGAWLLAAEWYLKYHECEGPMPIEKFQALTYAARAFRNSQKPQDAIKCDLMALELFPQWADPYVGLGMSYIHLKNPEKAVYWLEEAKKKGMPDEVIFINPLDYTFNISVSLFEAYAMMGKMEDARQQLNYSLAIRPIDELKGNLEMVHEAQAREAIVYGLKAMMNTHLKDGDLRRLRKLKEILPSWMEDFPETEQIIGGIDRHTSAIEVPESHTTLDIDTMSLVVGTDFFDRNHIPASANYASRVVCSNALEHIDMPVDECLARLEQFGDSVIVDIGKGNRVIGQRELEHAAVAPNRNITQLYKTDDGLHLEFDHNIPPDTGLGIKVYCGPGFERWDPHTIESMGCGGSEISVAYLSKELSDHGNKVIVYAEGHGVFDGVVYRRGWNPHTPCDVFISSRFPPVLDVQMDCVKLLWVHDVHCREWLTPDIANKIDGIIVLSLWHLDHMQAVYPWLKDCEVVDFRGDTQVYKDIPEPHSEFFPDAKLEKPPIIFVMSDAIHPDRFQPWPEVMAYATEEPVDHRNPHRFVWMSSPDRGLEQLLDLWPMLKEKLPLAELKIFYGWEYFDNTLWIPQQADLKRKLLEKLEALKPMGVEWCERANPEKLKQELLQASAWLYPPPHDFRETCCISAIECQAAGVICFYRANGALGETVGNRGILIPVDQPAEETVDLVVGVLTDPEECAKLREAGMLWANDQTYSRMAEHVEEMVRICRGHNG